MEDIWKYNKKEIIIGSIVVILILIVGFSLFSSNKEKIEVEESIDKLVLFGEREITLEEGEKYVEPGYYALTNTKEIKQEEIKVTPSDIDTTKPGTYTITYIIGDKKETRQIIIKEKEEDEEEIETDNELFLTLKGDSTIVLSIGKEYIEPGYIATDEKNVDITDKVKVSGEVNTGIAGTYTLTYEVENSLNKKVTKTRTIVVKNEVINASITGNPTSYTNKNVELKIEVTGENFYYVKYPNGSVNRNENSTYEIEKNGTYKFLIYDKSGNYVVKEVVVDKIDKTKPKGSCKAVVENNKTTITIGSEDKESGIKNYIIRSNGKELKNLTSSKYVYSGVLKSASVLIYDKALNNINVSCIITDNTKIESKTVTKETIIYDDDDDEEESQSKSVNSKYDYLELHMIVSGHYDDAILIRTGAATILIDGGRKGCYKEVNAYLKGLGVKTIDAIIGSHTDDDHIDAEADIIRNYKVLNAYYPVDLSTCYSKGYCDKSTDGQAVLKACKEKGLTPKVKKAGQKLTIGDMTLFFIGPPGYKSTGSHRGNANSFIFILKYKNNTFMFPGDADSGTFSVSKNKSYANKLGISLDVDVLKYPHHGNTSIDSSILSAMSPKYILIPNYNASKYPNSSNREKIKNTGAYIYENAKDGNIVLKSDGKKITVKTNQKASSYKR